MFTRKKEMSILRFVVMVGANDYQRLFIQFVHLNEKEALLKENRFTMISTLSGCSI